MFSKIVIIFRIGDVMGKVNSSLRKTARKGLRKGGVKVKKIGEATSTRPSHNVGKSAGEPQLERGLKNRHLQLIAIGGAVGTGLFLGAGRSIHISGPAIMLDYVFVGALMFFAMRILGELLLSNLNYKSFRDVASDILGPVAGYFVGWLYWGSWVVICMQDASGVAGYVKFWFPQFPAAVSALGMLVVLLICNLVAVRLFGELEFWFALIKIVLILAIIAVGGFLVIACFIAYTNNQPPPYHASFSNLYAHGGFFPNGILGAVKGFQLVFGAFMGVELVGTAAAETVDPEKNLPKAINVIPMRIAIFYIGSIFTLLLLNPWDKISPDTSPFVGMFVGMGITAAAGIVNFVVLTSAASSANSGIYSTSRMLYGLALDKSAPKRFAKLSKNRVPNAALLFSVGVIVPFVIAMQFSDKIITAFAIFNAWGSSMLVIAWLIVLVSYIVYMKKTPEKHKASKYKAPGGIVSAVIIFAFYSVILISTLGTPEGITGLIAVAITIAILSVMYYLFCRRDRALNA
jgi:D-serine/D-alanine/glycine transporter